VAIDHPEHERLSQDVVRRCPRSVALARSVPGVHFAAFSLMGPGATIHPHTDVGPRALRCHLPLRVPPGRLFQVREERRTWEEGRCLVFDGSRTHTAWNPSGEPHVMLARDEDGEVVAHFAGVPRRTLLEGRTVTFTVAVDSMVAPERRRGLQRHGLFADVVNRFIEHFCVGGPVQLAYGLANRPALRIGGRLLGYAPIEGAVLLARALPEVVETRGEVEVARSETPPEDLDELWARCARRHAVAACRDARFVDWRYRRAPGGGFEFLTVRRWGELAALVVFKADYCVPDSATLVDVLWAGADPGDLAACVRLAEALTVESGLGHLAALLPSGSHEAAVLAGLGYRPARQGLALVARSFRAATGLDRLASRFFFTCGDFDLV
jgi:hypothetical protein